MQFLKPKEHLYLVSVSADRGNRVFESEIQKKKVLDAVNEITMLLADTEEGRLRVYGYCVLDERMLLLAGSKDEEQMQKQCQWILDCYERKERGDKGKKTNWKSCIKEIQEDLFWEKLCFLHFLPVKEGYVIQPGHYWWSSCMEFGGRTWMPFQIRDVAVTLAPDGKRVKQRLSMMQQAWKKKHPEIYRKH